MQVICKSPQNKAKQTMLHIEIRYNDEELTQPWEVYVDGQLWRTASTYSKAEGLITWHSKNNTLGAY
jgi:hypothetical protein